MPRFESFKFDFCCIIFKLQLINHIRMSDFADQFPALLPFDIASSNELIQTLLDVSLTAINLLRPIYGAEGELIDFANEYLNAAGQRMLGLSTQPEGTMLTRFPQMQNTGVFTFYQQVFNSGEAGRYNVNYQYDGLDKFFQIAARRCGPLLVVSFTDTSDQNRNAAKQDLHESQTREQITRTDAEEQRAELQRVLEQAPVSIAIFRGPEFVVELANAVQGALWGRQPEQVIGRPLFEALPDLARQGLELIFEKVLQTGEPCYGQEIPMDIAREHTGLPSRGYFNFTYQPLRDAQGRTTGLMPIGVEVTEQVIARREVQQLNKKLDVRVQERSQEVQRARAEADRQRLRLENLFMQAPAAICILNGPDLVYELVNPAYQQLFPGRQLLGKPIVEALPEIVDNDVYRTFREVYETGRTHEEQNLLIPLARPEDGVLEDRYFKFIQQARHNENGQINGVLVFAFEITVQVQARKAMEQSAQQLLLVTDALPVLVGYLDENEKYRFANQAYVGWFNQKPEDLLGQPVREVIGEKAYKFAKPYIDRALTGERLNFETQMPYRENFKKYIQTSYVPDIRENKVFGFYTMVNDITEQVEARQAVEESEQQAQALAEELSRTNQDLRIANDQLTRINADLDNFIYTASHDLKAPILNIEGLMGVLLDSLPPAKLQTAPVQHIIDLILESVQRFKRTIDHLTEITKLQKENSPENSAVNLAAVIADVQSDLALAIQTTQAQLEINVTACPTICFSNKNLRSIVYNLLSNAIKYHAPERTPHVRIHCQEEGEYMVLTVQDNGLGFDLTQEHKLFAMFQRLHSHVEGSGIGLYMVNKIIQNTGGKIEVQSKIGQGSTFRVYFQRNS